MNDRPRFALRFISGKYQGGEFPLRMNREIIIGRSSDLDMVLVEDMVSRRHAKISSSEAEARRKLEAGAQQRQATQGRPMSGVIEEIPLPDLLQLLSTSRKSGVLSINNGVSIGKIFLRKGQIYFATINDDFSVKPQKAIYRMLTWATGTFELEPQ